MHLPHLCFGQLSSPVDLNYTKTPTSVRFGLGLEERVSKDIIGAAGLDDGTFWHLQLKGHT